jgi:hypothetical protein
MLNLVGKPYASPHQRNLLPLLCSGLIEQSIEFDELDSLELART